MEVVIVDVEDRRGLNPQHHRREAKLFRGESGPREEKGVDQAGVRTAVVSGRNDEIEYGPGPTTHRLRCVVFYFASGLEPVIVSVDRERREGHDRPVRGNGFLVGVPARTHRHAAAGGEGDEEGDVSTGGGEALGELQGRVYVTLCWVGYQDDAGPYHCMMRRRVMARGDIDFYFSLGEKL
ncbi:hypothetical protein PanWU01x14_186520 [Parasponia andersonii]|uniref:Uncharacterized protein n=1 Tax=Parasponia andersonii TaxID=3476 RepID=A0A2P5C3N7_PARAD|nr:hypothetical protein PanWU01x14_186520 [Parasponia andersonii]